MKIALLTAMESEYREVRRLIGAAPRCTSASTAPTDGSAPVAPTASSRCEAPQELEAEGTAFGLHIVLSRCGIGKVNAALGAAELLRRHRPDAVVSTGVAGGISPELRPMDLVVARQTLYHDVWCGDGNERGQVQGLPPRFDAHPALLEALAPLLTPTDGVAGDAPDARLVAGVICTGDQFITDRDALQHIRRQFPDGTAVDMESAAIAHACFLAGVPFVSLRIVSDTPGSTPDHRQQYAHFWDELSRRSFVALQRCLEALSHARL